MTTNDPIADMLTRVRDANTAEHDVIDVPTSKMKAAIADVLVNESYVEKYEFVGNKDFQNIRITLKYGATKNDRILSGLERISRPGLRIYAGKGDIPKIPGDLGTVVTSTNQGVIADKETRRLDVGGEVLTFIW